MKLIYKLLYNHPSLIHSQYLNHILMGSKSSERLSLSSISDNQQKILIERKEDIFALGILIQEIMLGPSFMELYVRQQTKGDLLNKWSPPNELNIDSGK